jgi:hypothetical protein
VPEPRGHLIQLNTFCDEAHATFLVTDVDPQCAPTKSPRKVHKTMRKHVNFLTQVESVSNLFQNKAYGHSSNDWTWVLKKG